MFLVTIVLLFLIQSITNLIKSIYLIDLLNTQLDANVLGLLFLFGSISLFIPLDDEMMQKITLSTGIAFRLVYPFFETTLRLILSGFAVFLFMAGTPLLIRNKRNVLPNAMAITILLSILFRSAGMTLDLSEIGWGQIVAWILAIFALYAILTDSALSETYNGENSKRDDNDEKNIWSIYSFLGILTLVYFAYGSPSVLARWVDSNYLLIMSLLLLSILFFVFSEHFMLRIYSNSRILLFSNFLFLSSLVGTILLNQVHFIDEVGAAPIYAPASNLLNNGVLYVNLLFFHVLLFDLKTISIGFPYSRQSLAKHFTMATFIFVVLVFMNIFSNVWGYVDPVSGYFRGLFWLPFAIATILVFPATLRSHPLPNGISLSTIILVLLLSLSSVAFTFSFNRPLTDTSPNLTVMTFNIQQGTDAGGNFGLKKQLDVIKSLNPDIIGLQESDIAKINTGNVDAVRYFAENLGYYSYYGPKTVMQTYGVSLLSRYPIVDAKTFYTYGDKDEIGTLQAKVDINGLIVNVFVNHPAGSQNAKWDHLNAVLNASDPETFTILMGDFNWDETSSFYNRTVVDYLDTWRTLYPNGKKDGLNMSRTIDHIFVSKKFTILNADYIMQSYSDHPAYVCEIIPA